MEKRINWIDIAKAIGITLVVLGHFLYSEDDEYFRNFIYSFHMPLFFFLSGYLYKQNNNLEESIKKDFTSLIVPYILLNIIAYIFLIPYYIHHEGLLKPIRCIFTIDGHAPAGACWFLISLFFIKFVMHFFLQISIRFQIAFILTITFMVYYITLFAPEFNTFRVGATCLSFPFFYLGYFIKKLNYIDLFQNNLLRFALFTLSFFVLAFSSNINGGVDLYSCILGNNHLLFYINGIIGIFMIIMFCLLFNKLESKFVRVISSGTILIMGLHANKPYFFYGLLDRCGTPISPSIMANIVIAIAIILLFYYPIIFVQKYIPILIGSRK